MWQNGGHAGADVVAANNGRLPDLDIGNIGDRIERPGRQNADLQPQIGSTGRELGPVYWAAAIAAANKTVVRMKNLRTMDSIRPNSGLDRFRKRPPSVGDR